MPVTLCPLPMSDLLHARPISPALPSGLADKQMDSVYIDSDAGTLRTEGLLARGLDWKLLINSLPLD